MLCSIHAYYAVYMHTMQYACIHAMQSTEKSADSHGDDTATCHSATSLSPYRHTMQHHTIIPTNQTMPYHTVPYHATSYYHASKLYQTKLQPVIVPPACRHTTIPCNTTLLYHQTKPYRTIPYHATSYYHASKLYQTKLNCILSL